MIESRIIFAFFIISLLLFSGNALTMTSYSQPPPQEQQPLPSPSPEGSTTTLEICDNFVDDDADGYMDSDDPEGCVPPAAGSEGNMTVQPLPSENVTVPGDNFSAAPIEPLVDEFGNPL